MSEFFTNLLDRHLGACNVVEPRGRSRFETEVAGSVIPLPIDHSGTDETGGENLERQDSAVRIPKNHLVGPPANSIEPQRIDTEVKLPIHHTDPVDAMGNNLERQDDLIRPTANDSILADVNAPEMEPHLGTPVLRQQDWQSVKPKPVEQTNPTKEAKAHASELGYHFESELDNRIRTMLARLQDYQKVRPAEHAETNNLDRSVLTRADSAGDTEKEPAAQPLRVVPLFDESEKVGPSDSDQERQYAFASDNRDISRDGSLEPPTWFSDMQAEFNRRWNELNRKSQPEPVINVTIGRIEVKAIKLLEPEQPRQQKKPAGVMSLDKYLSQSGRGGRG